MYTLRDRRQVNKWIARGASDYAIAGITGIPRSTVQRWRTKPLSGPRKSRYPGGHYRPPNAAVYAYLLGLYLGDGCLSPGGGVLMLAFDARYPGIVDAAEEAVKTTIPGINTHRYRPKQNLVRLVASSTRWRDLFPQHGPGRSTSASFASLIGNSGSPRRFPGSSFGG